MVRKDFGLVEYAGGGGETERYSGIGDAGGVSNDSVSSVSSVGNIDGEGGEAGDTEVGNAEAGKDVGICSLAFAIVDCSSRSSFLFPCIARTMRQFGCESCALNGLS